MAGLGAAMFTGNVQRGDSVAVFGCGGVGDAAIIGARLAGAARIIAVDVDATKLEWAREFGATDVVDASKEDAVEAVRALTDGFGADVCVEAVGRPEVMQQAFFARDLAGTLVQVGVPDPSMTIELPMIEFFGRGGALKPSWYGDCLPSRDFPMLVDLHLQGRLPPRPVRERADRPRRRRGRRFRRWSGARSSDRWSCCEPASHSTTSSRTARSRSTARTSRSTTTSGSSATTRECLVIDAAHEAAPVVEAVGGREVVAVVCTHGHNDHINAAAAVADATGAPILLHPDDRMLWDVVYPDRAPDGLLADGERLAAGGTELVVLHTPGHSPGGVSLYDEEHAQLFSGDTLFRGGPGATGRSYSDRDTIVHSIRSRLLTLPAETLVHTGHGDDTTIGAEATTLEA